MSWFSSDISTSTLTVAWGHVYSFKNLEHEINQIAIPLKTTLKHPAGKTDSVLQLTS